MVKATVPVALVGETETPGVAGGEIVAVNVTGWPIAAVGADEVSADGRGVARTVAEREPGPHVVRREGTGARRAAPVARSIM